jgi:hypothetical protein
LGIDRLEDIKREVEMLQASAATERLEKKELKLAAKPKAAKPAKAKKVATKKAKKVQAAATLVAMDEEDDVQTLVVDGTK